MANAKAETIGLKDLNVAVEHAVKAAVEKHKIQLQPGLTVLHGPIIGRVLREELRDVGQAQQLATELTHAIEQARGKQAATAPRLQPAVTWQHNHIFVGFVERQASILTLD